MVISVIEPLRVSMNGKRTGRRRRRMNGMQNICLGKPSINANANVKPISGYVFVLMNNILYTHEHITEEVTFKILLEK